MVKSLTNDTTEWGFDAQKMVQPQKVYRPGNGMIQLVFQK